VTGSQGPSTDSLPLSQSKVVSQDEALQWLQGLGCLADFVPEGATQNSLKADDFTSIVDAYVKRCVCLLLSYLLSYLLRVLLLCGRQGEKAVEAVSEKKLGKEEKAEKKREERREREEKREEKRREEGSRREKRSGEKRKRSAEKQ
jgi:hypothetical protein